MSEPVFLFDDEAPAMQRAYAAAQAASNISGASWPGSAGAAPDAFRDHPMCVNMLGKIEQYLAADPATVQSVDAAGSTLLHREALAGNFGVVKLLAGHGADPAARTRAGKTASELARGIGWPEIAGYLQEQSNR